MARKTVRRRAVRRGGAYIPSADAVQREIDRVRHRRYRKHRENVLLTVMVISLALGTAAFYFGFDLVIARGSGMSPAIEGGSLVLCVKQSLLNQLAGIVPEQFRRLRRDDLALIRYRSEGAPEEASTLLIRRVAALGGDVIDLAAGELILNQDVVIGDAGVTDRVYPVTVPGGRLFVTGDQRGLAIDSRSRAFGYVAQEDVVGRPVAIIWPIYAIGPVQ